MKYKYSKEKYFSYVRDDIQDGIRREIVKKEWEKTQKAIENKKDSDIRIKIHEVIVRMRNEGKSKEEILEKLLNDFPDFNLKDKFPRWINDQFEKYNVPDKSVDEER